MPKTKKPSLKNILLIIEKISLIKKMVLLSKKKVSIVALYIYIYTYKIQKYRRIEFRTIFKKCSFLKHNLN